MAQPQATFAGQNGGASGSPAPVAAVPTAAPMGAIPAWQQQYYDQLLEQQKNFTPEQLAQYQAFYQHFTAQLQATMAVTAAAGVTGAPMAMPQLYQPPMQTFTANTPVQIAQQPTQPMSVTPQPQPQPTPAPVAAPAPEIDMTSTVNSYLAMNDAAEPGYSSTPPQMSYASTPSTPLATSQHIQADSTPGTPLGTTPPNSFTRTASSSTGSWGMSTVVPGTPPHLSQSEGALARSGSFGTSPMMSTVGPSSLMMSTVGPSSPLSSSSSIPVSPMNRSSSSRALGAEGDTPVGSPAAGAFTGPKQPPVAGSRDVVRDDLVFFSKNFQIVIKGGTVEKLVERLTFESTTDSDYVETFLLTYRSMISPQDLLEKLFLRYEHGMTETEEEQSATHLEAESTEKKQKIIRLRVGNVIKRWLSEHFHDFEKDPTLLEKLVANLARIQEKNLVDQLKKAIADAQTQSAKKKDHVFSTPPPPSVTPKTANFEDFEPIEIARQLCLIEQDIYTLIHPKECLNQSWNKRKEQAPNIIKMIQFFNVFSKWVATKLVSEPDLKARVKLLKKFVQTLIFLRQYNNFDSMQAILAGLNNAAVFRLKLTWTKLEKEKFWPLFVECRDIMDSTGSFNNYRKTVQAADPPIIPYLGVYLTDLTFIEDGNPDMLPVQDGRTDIVNFEKMRKVAAVIKDICTYQQTPYNFSKVDAIQNFFLNGKLDTLDDNPLFKKSREIESPELQQQKLKKKDSGGLLRKFSFSAGKKSNGTPEK